MSSWNRPAPNTLPQMAKAAANYMNSQLIRMEAKANGYAEGIALDVNGHVSEGSGENIFLALNGTVITPPLLEFRAPRHHPRLRSSPSAAIWIFPSPNKSFRAKCSTSPTNFSSAARLPKITPIRSVDRIKVGTARADRSPSASRTNSSRITSGKKPDRHGWLSPGGRSSTGDGSLM